MNVTSEVTVVMELNISTS